jgi:hypothetical protein
MSALDRFFWLFSARWEDMSPVATSQADVSLFFDFSDISKKRVVAGDISSNAAAGR